jgi:hypothetical protein
MGTVMNFLKERQGKDCLQETTAKEDWRETRLEIYNKYIGTEK